MARSSAAKAIGRRTRALRKAAGLTLTDAADRAKIDAGNLSKLENGKGPSSPGTETLARIAGALRVPLTALLDDSAAESCLAAREPNQDT
jgi:transcriptional regulator with XRE-family HTH domain